MASLEQLAKFQMCRIQFVSNLKGWNTCINTVAAASAAKYTSSVRWVVATFALEVTYEPVSPAEYVSVCNIDNCLMHHKTCANKF